MDSVNKGAQISFRSWKMTLWRPRTEGNCALSLTFSVLFTVLLKYNNDYELNNILFYDALFSLFCISFNYHGKFISHII
mgnify:CR=1 FL=1